MPEVKGQGQIWALQRLWLRVALEQGRANKHPHSTGAGRNCVFLYTFLCVFVCVFVCVTW